MGSVAKRFIVGIDEVGRGPLAGPVVVCALLMPAGLKFDRKGLRDSKKLTETSREDWVRKIEKHPDISYALARISPKTIDRINISKAANLAAFRAFTRLAAKMNLTAKNCSVYLDGGLYLGNGSGRLPGKTVVKGDETIPAVSLASIVAKVRRDATMVRHAKDFPGYGFEVHKGYGTAMHLKALRRIGPSSAHRLTFLKKLNTIDRKSHGRRTNKTSYTR
jgi:ribonuclease HII